MKHPLQGLFYDFVRLRRSLALDLQGSFRSKAALTARRRRIPLDGWGKRGDALTGDQPLKLHQTAL
jgi:hypothetical protein